MSNVLATAISQNKETFKNFRLFLIYKGFTKEQVLTIENGTIEVYIPRCIKYIESLEINFNEAVNYYSYERPDVSYWELISVAIVGCFRKIENQDFNYNIF